MVGSAELQALLERPWLAAVTYPYETVIRLGTENDDDNPPVNLDGLTIYLISAWDIVLTPDDPGTRLRFAVSLAATRSRTESYYHSAAGAGMSDGYALVNGECERAGFARL